MHSMYSKLLAPLQYVLASTHILRPQHKAHNHVCLLNTPAFLPLQPLTSLNVSTCLQQAVGMLTVQPIEADAVSSARQRLHAQQACT